MTFRQSRLELPNNAFCFRIYLFFLQNVILMTLLLKTFFLFLFKKNKTF
jgi:hypothetical protein